MSTETPPVVHYTTIGSVRGSCGHEHQTIRTALSCLTRDQAGCKSQGGYSDRRVVRTDGESLDEVELDELDLLRAEIREREACR